ncbi:hypothetical protein PINS_up022599 [Pythium insidiosum]|nr:hypothetical protein PINS_up022599 [Pythium insidiosum]
MKDAEPAESLEELAEFEALLNANKENETLVDEVLPTATIFGETVNSTRLPANGSQVRITNSRKRMVYEGKKCQLVARVSDIQELKEEQ